LTVRPCPVVDDLVISEFGWFEGFTFRGGRNVILITLERRLEVLEEFSSTSA